MRHLVTFVCILWSATALSADAAKPNADVISDVSKATVLIRSRFADGSVAAASGFVVDSAGAVVTNYHVVKDAISVEIRLPSDEVYPVSGTRGIDQLRDIAILQVPGFSLPSVKLGDSNLARAGERILVVGTPLGFLDNSVTAGIVSGVREMGGYRLIQMDAAISHGNSGGPVIREDGSVIGIAKGSIETGENLNFAVPINYARGLLQLPVTAGLQQLATSSQTSLFAGSASSSSTENRKTESSSSDAVAMSFPSTWTSTSTGHTKYISIQGDRLRIENDLPRDLARNGASSVIELKREGDAWVGSHTERVNCRPMPLTRRRVCPAVKLPVKITVLTPTLIEGVGEYDLNDSESGEFSCRDCAFVGTREPKFVWLPR